MIDGRESKFSYIYRVRDDNQLATVVVSEVVINIERRMVCDETVLGFLYSLY